MGKEYFIVGTRPEIIKIMPIILKLDPSEYVIIHTGQHRELAKEAYDAFDIQPNVDFELMQDNQTLPDFTAKCYSRLVEYFKDHARYANHVWVMGDTSTALCGAQVAKLYNLRVIHIEAGLRSFDMKNPWPEEMFRTQIDALSDVLLAPTPLAKHNLIFTQFEYYPAGQKIYDVTGNTVVDALELMKTKLSDKSPQNVPFVLATIHRRESFGPRMIEIFRALRELSKTIKVVIPAHPNPNVRKALEEVGLEYVEPMSYIAFLNHLKFCEYVITDSGGVQEEAPSFEKKTIVLREVTERPEAVNAGMSILIENFDKEYIINMIKQYASINVQFSNNPFGDGHAADKIIMNLKDGIYD